MAAGRIKGITIEIGGDTTKLTKALSAVDNSIRNTQTNINDLNRALKLDPGNTNLIVDKQKELAVAVDAAKQKLETEKEALKQLEQTDGFDKNSQQARNLQTQIDLDTVALKELEEEAKSCGSVIGQQMEAAGQKISSVGDKIRGVGDKISGLGRTLTTSITVPVVAAGTAAVKMASDYEENLNKVDVAFKDSADQVKEWAKNATTQFGLSENAALEATSLFGDMGTAMGLTEEEAANMSTSLAGLAGDLSSFKNVDIEQAMNALKGVFTGETESLKNLGIVMTQTNLEEFADKTGRVYQEMSQAEKVALRYEYVIANTQNAQGDYARTSDGMANSIRTMQASLQNLGVTFGQEILPYITPLIQKVTELIQQFASLDDETKKTIIKVAAIAAAIGPLLLVGGKLISGIGTVVSLFGNITSGVGNLMTSISGLTGASGIGGLPSLLGALTNPVGIAVAAIAALAGGFVYLYQTNDEFAAHVNEKWEEIKSKLSEAWENIKPIFEKIGETFTSLMETLTPVFQYLFDVIVKQIENVMNLVGPVMEVVGNAASYIMDAIGLVVALLTGDFDGALDHAQGMLDAFVGVWQGMWDTVKAVVENVFSAFGLDLDEVGRKLNAFLSAAGRGWEKFKAQTAKKWANIKESISTNAKNAWSAATDWFGKMASNIESNSGSIGSAITDKIGAAIQWLMDLPGKAWNWGKDLIGNFVDGIKGALDTAGEAAGWVADKIGAFLHFSEPDEGALKNFHTFAPDMIKLFAQGIYQSLPILERATDQMAGVIANDATATIQGGQTAASKTVNAPISINVYGAAGQDVNQLADIIQQKMNRAVVNQRAVFA